MKHSDLSSDLSSNLSQSIHAQVRTMYEAYPYPHYPLLARPRWQEGYLSSSLVQSRLAGDLLGHPLSVSLGGLLQKEILIAGCGEMQPYIMRKWEPPHHSLTCVDLSANSLKRARLRLLTSMQPTNFVEADINEFLASRPEASFDHGDAYGVLHHLADPSLTCTLLAQRLRAGASLRVMVYNGAARQWIHQLQRVFRLVGLSPYQKEDLKLARQLLVLAGHHMPALQAKLACLSSLTLQNDSRFIDTFFHVRELTLSPKRWLELFAACGLQGLALFDRYGELDDLANPLWRMPSSQEISERSKDGRFENNLELILYKNLGSATGMYARKAPVPLGLRRASPPLAWFSFRETKTLGMRERYHLWAAYLNYVWGQPCPRSYEKTLQRLPLNTLQRLARVGAIMPGMLSSLTLRSELSAPMVSQMLPPDHLQGVGTSTTPLKAFIEAALNAKNRFSSKRHNLILNRLDRSQD